MWRDFARKMYVATAIGRELSLALEAVQVKAWCSVVIIERNPLMNRCTVILTVV